MRTLKPGLSKRLQAIADMAPHCRLVADIGTDHGKLPLHLVASGIAERALATDISSKSLDKLRKALESAPEADRIRCIVGDGLTSFVEEVPEVVVIAGMGGYLMIRMLESAPEIAGRIDHFVLQPNTDIEALRRFLHEKKYAIVRETSLTESKHFYQILYVTRGEEKYSKTCDYRYGQFNLLHQDKATYHHLCAEKKRVEQLIDDLLRLERIDQRAIEQLKSEQEVIEEALCYYETD